MNSFEFDLFEYDTIPKILNEHVEYIAFFKFLHTSKYVSAIKDLHIDC